MESTYLRFERPDGSIFNKLPSIPKEQIAAYKQAGCKLKRKAVAKTSDNKAQAK